jgi:MYXO-CTERM domain-containing protein
MRAVFVLLLCAGPASASVSNLQSDWSEISNPFGPWALREGTNALPHVDAWQRTLGGWTAHQPGWARSEDLNTRLPFFFRSNGTETFAHDWAEGAIVVHSTDAVNGVGSGHANLAFTVQNTGTLTATGGLWIGRDIGRSVRFDVLLNGVALTGGVLASGDAFSSADPFGLAEGTGGPGALDGLGVTAGDVFELRFTTLSSAGDFVVIDLTIDNPVPAPAGMGVLALGLLAARRRRVR